MQGPLFMCSWAKVLQNVWYNKLSYEVNMHTLLKNNRSRQKIAEELGISTATLWRKMKKYGIAE